MDLFRGFASIPLQKTRQAFLYTFGVNLNFVALGAEPNASALIIHRFHFPQPVADVGVSSWE